MDTGKDSQTDGDRSRGFIVGRALALIVGLAFSLALGGAPVTSTIELPKAADTGSFARYVPFGDTREVIVRRSEELGFRYGIELSRRKVKIEGRQFELVQVPKPAVPAPIGSRPGTPVCGGGKALQAGGRGLVPARC